MKIWAGMVSAVTPAYNAGLLLPEVAATIFSQSFQNWEWIIVDDGSEDGTWDELQRLSDPRIRILRQKNRGVSAARNAALDVAQGEFVTFLDADDRLPPRALEIRANYLAAHPEVDIVNGTISVTSDGSEIRRYVPSLDETPLFPHLARLSGDVFFGPFYMLRRSCIGNHRFPVGVTHCEDLIFFLTLAHDLDLRYGAVADEVYEYRLQPNSAMRNLDGLEAGYMALLRHAASLPRLDAATRRYMKRRVASILIKSWIRRGEIGRALAVPGKILAA